MRLVGLVVGSVLLVGGCAVPVSGHPMPVVDPPAATDTAPLGSFDDAMGRFALVPPPGWVADTSGASGTVALFRDPLPSASNGGDFTANLNVVLVPSATELPATVQAARGQAASARGYSSVRDEDFTLADGTPAHLLGARFADPSGRVLRNVQLFAVRDGRTVVVTGTALDASWDQYAGAFDSTLHTVTMGAAPAVTGATATPAAGAPAAGGTGLAE